MGKPFQKEILRSSETYQWAILQPTDDFRNEILNNRLPLFIVGSGGSLSVCHYAAMLYQQHGTMAKALTPLELIYSKNALRNSKVLFVSASGRNTDILFSYKTAIENEPDSVYTICMKQASPLAKLAHKNSITKVFEYENPAGKDGFLATNSLIGFFTVFYRAMATPNDQFPSLDINTDFFEDLNLFISKVTPEYTFTILHAGWGQPVAIDIESKLAESALADVLLSDYRNFGHGRHHWFDKRKENAAIIALITPKEEQLALKTLSVLPDNIPVLIIRSHLQDASASIELLMKSFHFVSELGKMQGIDPGRPGVPEFGSKLYHLKYERFYVENKKDFSDDIRNAITRKAHISSFNLLSDTDKKYWLEAYKEYVRNLTSVQFGAIIFDYDGTLCSAENRFIGIDKPTKEHLIKFLKHGAIIGIATGRGQSVRLDLQQAIPEEYWDQIVVGYYNCSDIGLLRENDLPNKSLTVNPNLQYIYEQILQQKFIAKIQPELRPNQIIIEIIDKNEWSKVRPQILHHILSLNMENIQILESSHSMDIIDQRHTNKLNIIEFCSEIAKQRKLSEQCLCIGDKGKWPGNDYQLLSTKYSLSVDEVSSTASNCWNLAKTGIKGVDATLYYLSCLSLEPYGLTFNIS